MNDIYKCRGCRQRNVSWDPRSAAFLCRSLDCASSYVPPYPMGDEDRDRFRSLMLHGLVPKSEVQAWIDGEGLPPGPVVLVVPREMYRRLLVAASRPSGCPLCNHPSVGGHDLACPLNKIGR